MRAFLAGLLFCACATPVPAPEPLELGSEASEVRAACRAPSADWAFSKLGVVRGLPDAERAGDGLLAPAALVHEGRLHLWFVVKTGLRHTLLHAVSEDGGASFAPPEAVEGTGDDHVTAYPSVWRQDGRFMLLYGSGSFSIAASHDGVRFERVNERVLGASFVPGRFDALSILYPSRVWHEDASVLFFAGFDGHRVRIGRALAAADGAYVVDPPEPVVDLGDATAFDNTSVAQPHVRRAFDRYWMWYGGYDTSRTNPGPYRIGFAESDDGVVWRKHGVALELSEHGSDAWSTRDPALVPFSGRWLMFYAGLGEDGRYRLHRATSEVCALSR